MQTVVHVAHHIEPAVISLAYHSLWTVAGLSGAALLVALARSCRR